MALKFSKIPKYKEDIRKYKKLISQIQSNKIKNKAEDILKQLEWHASLLDNAYDTSMNGYINPKFADEDMRKTIELRIQLEKILR